MFTHNYSCNHVVSFHKAILPKNHFCVKLDISLTLLWLWNSSLNTRAQNQHFESITKLTPPPCPPSKNKKEKAPRRDFFNLVILLSFLAGAAGFEPATYGFGEGYTFSRIVKGGKIQAFMDFQNMDSHGLS